MWEYRNHWELGESEYVYVCKMSRIMTSVWESRTRAGDPAPEAKGSCLYVIGDNQGNPVCIKNLNAPGWCQPRSCPYGGPFEEIEP